MNLISIDCVLFSNGISAPQQHELGVLNNIFQEYGMQPQIVNEQLPDGNIAPRFLFQHPEKKMHVIFLNSKIQFSKAFDITPPFTEYMDDISLYFDEIKKLAIEVLDKYSKIKGVFKFNRISFVIKGADVIGYEAERSWLNNNIGRGLPWINTENPTVRISTNETLEIAGIKTNAITNITDGTVQGMNLSGFFQEKCLLKEIDLNTDETDLIDRFNKVEAFDLLANLKDLATQKWTAVKKMRGE